MVQLGHLPTGLAAGPTRPSGPGRPRPATSALTALAVLLSALGVLLGGALPAQAAPAPFTPLAAPYRLLDTRTNNGPKVTSAAVLVLGRAAIPTTGVAAVSLNVTVVAPSADGWVTVVPCGGSSTATSSVNFTAGSAVPNAVVVAVGSGGKVCLSSSTSTHLVVDVNGWFATGGITTLPSPVRLADTRPGRSAVDTDVSGRGPLTGAEFAVPVSGRGGISATDPVVALNITVVSARTSGFYSVYPCGSPRPLASTINFTPGTTRANATIASIGLTSAGVAAVCIAGSGTADVIVDAGATMPSSTFTSLPAPQRLLDTRAGQPTSDNAFAGVGAEPANATVTLPVAGRVGLPSTAKAVVLNVTAVFPTGPGFTTVFPQGPTIPTASNLNYGTNQVVANMVVAPLAPDGSVCLSTWSASTHLIVDVTGSLSAAPPTSSTTTPCPALSVNTNPDTVRTSLVYRAPMQRVVGQDTIGVIGCTMAAGYPGTALGSDVTSVPNLVSWLNANVKPYFTRVSGGAYTPVFTYLSKSGSPFGSTSVQGTSTDPNVGPGECLDKAIAAATTSSWTNVLVVNDRMTEYGFGGPGFLPGTSARYQDVLHQGPPSSSGRGFFVGGLPAFYTTQTTPAAPLPNAALITHELGHTLHWSHSYYPTTAGTAPDEYNSPVDLMSGNAGAPGNGWCDDQAGYSFACRPQSALAFDRMAAGWMTPQQSAINSGVTTYVLDAPAGTKSTTSGTQVVAVRDPRDPNSVLTIEARPAVNAPTSNGADVGPDDGVLTGSYCHVIDDPSNPGSTMCDPSMTGIAHDGVLVSYVRESATAVADSPDGCDVTGSVDLGYGLCRRSSPAFTAANGPTPYTFNSLLRPTDGTVTIAGVSITVLSRTATSFTVRVSGTYTTPAFMTAQPATTAVARAATPSAGTVAPADTSGAGGEPLRTLPEAARGTRR